MRERILSVPEIALFAGTRVALGIGIGMLLSGKFSRDFRRGAGWALVTVGALTTIPIVAGAAHRTTDRGLRPSEAA